MSIGPLSWTQGYEHALAALALLAGRGVRCRYRAVGAGEHLDALAFARCQLGLQDVVELPGAGTAADRREHLRWADVYLCPAVVAGAPHAVADALAAGLPVVGSGRSDEPGDASLLVPPRDPGALSAALAGLAGDPALRSRLAAAARLRGPAAPSPRDLAARLGELYAGSTDPLRPGAPSA